MLRTDTFVIFVPIHYVLPSQHDAMPLLSDLVVALIPIFIGECNEA